MSIPFPNWSPEIISVDVWGMHLAVRWYALAYIAGLLFGWRLILQAIRTPRLWSDAPVMTAEQLERLLTWVIAGVVLGGRIGYVLFYEPNKYIAKPLDIIKVWDGGMSFHGGFLGVVIAGIVFCRRENISAMWTGDMMAMAAPVGLFLGRIANFINAELWGRQTNLPWGFTGDSAHVPPCVGLGIKEICARHPSQIYEALLEGVLLGVLVTWVVWRAGWLKWPGRTMGLFIAGYAASRFLVEFVRQPDREFVPKECINILQAYGSVPSPEFLVSQGCTNPLGLAWQIHGWGLTQGQALSVPMLLVGLYFLLRARPA